MSNRERDALIHLINIKFKEFEISQLQSAAVSIKIHLEIRMFVSSTFRLLLEYLLNCYQATQTSALKMYTLKYVVRKVLNGIFR
jgi:hypothetical protein